MELLWLERANNFSFIDAELNPSPLACVSLLLNYQSPPFHLDVFPIISEPPPHLTRQKDGINMPRDSRCLSTECSAFRAAMSSFVLAGTQRQIIGDHLGLAFLLPSSSISLCWLCAVHKCLMSVFMVGNHTSVVNPSQFLVM